MSWLFMSFNMLPLYTMTVCRCIRIISNLLVCPGCLCLSTFYLYIQVWLYVDVSVLLVIYWYVLAVYVFQHSTLYTSLTVCRCIRIISNLLVCPGCLFLSTFYLYIQVWLYLDVSVLLVIYRYVLAVYFFQHSTFIYRSDCISMYSYY